MVAVEFLFPVSFSSITFPPDERSDIGTSSGKEAREKMTED